MRKKIFCFKNKYGKIKYRGKISKNNKTLSFSRDKTTS